MPISSARSVGDLATEIPSAISIFERLGIDYCCSGETTLYEACRASGANPEEVARELDEAERSSGDHSDFRDWSASTLGELVNHILETHHVFTKNELDRLDHLVRRVCAAHGAKHQELLSIQGLFSDLKQELLAHLQKEEMMLFPYLYEIERSAASGARTNPPVFGTVRNPIRVMAMEHDNACEMLRNIRELSSEYTPPSDADESYAELYRGLNGLATDLHMHIHLENNILFPNAVEMENL